MSEPSDFATLMADLESDRVERKSSASDGEKIRQAICAFANDLPHHRKPGYVFVGIDDRGVPTGLPIDDGLLRTLADMRSDGNILPIPTMTVRREPFRGVPVAVIEVHPSISPPVRFRGQTWIRVGPSRRIATWEEERRLTERAVAGSLTFDRRPCLDASRDDLLLGMFESDYLPQLVEAATLVENRRTREEQLASARLFDLSRGVPTNAGVLLVGRDPLQYLPGAYVQFVRFDGKELSDAIQDEKALTGNLLTQLVQLNTLLPLQIHSARGPQEGLKHGDQPDYPVVAIRELVLNAVMHRTYEGTSSPVRINWFHDRVEIQNPGGLYGQVTPENYRRVSDYRNPVLAEAMKVLGYVERFGVGIARADAALAGNGNPPAEFVFEATHVLVTVRSRP